MSRVGELLGRLAPEGVEFVRLGDVGRWYGGATPTKAKREYWVSADVPWLSPKDMGDGTILATQDGVSHAAVAETTLRLVPAGSVAFVVRSNVLRRRLPIALVPMAVTLNQDMRAVVPDETVDVAYLAHVCRASAERILAVAGRTDGSMAAVRGPALLDFRIPVPPLEVQREVVASLDRLERLATALEVDLEAELAARRRQYEHYRDALLTFPRAGGGWMTLGEVVDILDRMRKPIAKTLRIGGPYPYYGANGIVDWVDDYLFEGVHLLVGEDGSVLNRDGSPVVNWACGQIWVNNHAHVLAERPEGVSLRFLFHFLQTADVTERARGVPPKLNQADLRSIPVPVPGRQEQDRVVEILDRFDALVSDLCVGLSAEITARRRQYEHYRNRLLRFAEVA